MKKKGFTLIELLAVIIVIAVIAIITVPTILGVIDKSKKAAYKDSVYGIIESAKIYLAMNQENIKPTEEIEFVCNGIACSRETNGDNLLFKGTVPKSGSIYLQADGSVLVESVYNGKYYANNETGEVVITEADTTLTRGELTQRLINLEKKYNTEVTSLKNEVVSLNNQISNLKANATSIDKVYPVGSIYISTSNVNPGTLKGFEGTTWEAYGQGRTLVGMGGSYTTVNATGGNSSITLAVGQLPTHKHSIPALSGSAATTGSGYSIGYTYSSRTTSSNGNHSHNVSLGPYWYHSDWTGGNGWTRGSTDGYYGAWWEGKTNESGNHDHTVPDYYANSISGVGPHGHNVTTAENNTGNTGSGSAINIMNPYITVYMWKRIS